MGHEIAVTPMQIVMAMSAIANKGVLMKPMLVSRLEDDHGATAVTYEPQMVRRVISESASRSMLQALKKVVTTNGTAIKAAIPGYTVAGKTGTAEKAGRDPRTGKAGYLPGKFYTSFVGFFPADEPEVCMIVMFDEPKHGHFGGDVAAPVFRRIGEKVAQYLAIPPDVEVVPHLALSGGAR
jgi:cell division protein FtsI/penicillin-binding protein 2